MFQNFNLIPVLTGLENVELPLKLTQLKKMIGWNTPPRRFVWSVLKTICATAARRPSGCQEQRVAIADAIAGDGDPILADEPTGSLEASSAREVFTLNERFGKTIVMVTHHPHAARFARKTRHLKKGVLLPEGQLPEEWTEALLHTMGVPQ